MRVKDITAKEWKIFVDKHASQFILQLNALGLEQLAL
jgi:hypothetical protein